MDNKLFWKRVSADVAIVAALILVGGFVYSYYQKTKELSAYKQQEVAEQVKVEQFVVKQ